MDHPIYYYPKKCPAVLIMTDFPELMDTVEAD